MSRIYAIADIHTDQRDNLQHVKTWKSERYGGDTLIIAGDVSESITLLEQTLSQLTKAFDQVFFVPGNHDLWVKGDKEKNSFQKFHEICRLCDRLGVKTRPGKVSVQGGNDVMIIPLFSWYTTPEEDSMDTLYVRHPSVREDLTTTNLMWMDNHNCVWPTLYDSYPAQYFCELNEDVVSVSYDLPVISFSHFMPRSDLILPSEMEDAAVIQERSSLGLQPCLPQNQGAPTFFNFSRFAGCKQLDVQIRQLGSSIHFHGHQHRNRDRVIAGVRYISHSLGYKRERDEGLLWGMSHWRGPRQIWPLSETENMPNIDQVSDRSITIKGDNL